MTTMHPDFRDISLALNAQNAKYLIVGGYAVGVHAEPRATKDLDLWIQSSAENSRASRLASRRCASTFFITSMVFGLTMHGNGG
jgi:hypothetical protein